MEISFYFLSPVYLRSRNILKKFIVGVFNSEYKIASSLSFVFCSDNYLVKINKDYLSHNYNTDIITFNLSEEKSKIITGEIYISVDTVRDNAKTYKTTISKELHRVIFHGVLHLCGYDDKTKKDQIVMTKKEDYYLDKYFNVPRATKKNVK